MYEHETVKYSQVQILALLDSFCGKHNIEGLLGRQGALEREIRVCKRMHCIEDIFMTGQIALNLGIPDSEL